MKELFKDKINKEILYIGNGVSDSEINEAENEIKVKFADEYRCYLKECGILCCAGNEITGLGKKGRLDVVEVTMEGRNYNPSIPTNAYVVENTAVDGIIVWQDDLGIIYQSDMAGNFIKIADSLLEYINMN